MIQLHDVCKQFKQNKKDHKKNQQTFVKVVQNVNFQCQAGKAFALVGANGAGKTTLLRMISTMMMPSSGDIQVCGLDTRTDALAIRHRIGFLTTNTALYEHMTAYETVRFYADLFDIDAKLLKQRQDELFTLLGIHDFAHKRIKELSTGMRQKVNIARTLIHEPEILLLDEPTTGLDIIASQHIVKLIQCYKEKNTTIVFSTHHFGEIKLLCDDIAVMVQGKLEYKNSLEHFEAQVPGHSLEEKFISLQGKSSE
ncbi:MAG: ABC transporter ATP-binding protein [Mariprofundaceae bacterium]|nr:ABC transporter ATP-binding protein [Mariprofundaceae bacterium]